MPLDFTELVGIYTKYETRTEYSSAGYRYAARYTLRAREAIAAFEVRCTVFNIWGEATETLKHTEVTDMSAGSSQLFSPEWNLYESDASEYYASLCFMARVRTSTGRITAANMEPIVEEASRFARRFTAEDLEPTPTRAP